MRMILTDRDGVGPFQVLFKGQSVECFRRQPHVQSGCLISNFPVLSGGESHNVGDFRSLRDALVLCVDQSDCKSCKSASESNVWEKDS